jgi:hypothetical protein
MKDFILPGQAGCLVTGGISAHLDRKEIPTVEAPQDGENSG